VKVDWFGVAVFALGFLVAQLPQPFAIGKRTRNPSNDVIVACLQKSGMPSYGVGPAGPPVIGKPLTAEMFTVICVEEK
jgi:hypothetical protein